MVMDIRGSGSRQFDGGIYDAGVVMLLTKLLNTKRVPQEMDVDVTYPVAVGKYFYP